MQHFFSDDDEFFPKHFRSAEKKSRKPKKMIGLIIFEAAAATLFRSVSGSTMNRKKPKNEFRPNFFWTDPCSAEIFVDQNFNLRLL